jgi:hypothetical protein
MMKNLQKHSFAAYLLYIAISASAQNGLIISEITDPADDFSGRFVELFNAGSEDIDFSTETFYLSRQSNGGTGWGDLQLVGNIPPGETFVIGGSGFESLYGFLPDQESGILIGNGNDAYFLFKNGDHTSGLLHDIYGVQDVDGSGEAWEYTDSRALRKSEVISANTSWTSDEWTISVANFADCDPGTHHGSGGGIIIPPGEFLLQIASDTAFQGRMLEIPVSCSELKSEDGIISFQFELDYNADVLEYTGVNLNGTIADGGTIVVNTSNINKISLSYMNSVAIIGEGPLVHLQFNTLTIDTTELILSNAYLNNSPVQNMINSEVIILPTLAPIAILSYSDTINRFTDTLHITATFNDEMDPDNEVALNFTGALELSDILMTRQGAGVYTCDFYIPKADGIVTVRISKGNNIWGTPAEPVPGSGALFSILKFNAGDVDDDGYILAYDAALTLQYSVGLDPIPTLDPWPWEAWRDSTANVDNVAGITANDAGMILQYSAGIINSFSQMFKKATGKPDVEIRIVDDHMVFYSIGNLLGLNITINNKNAILGIPVTIGGQHLLAFNETEQNFRIGVCTAVPPASGTEFLKIPFFGESPILLKMLINTTEKNVKLNLVSSKDEVTNSKLEVYPNPASGILNVDIGEYFLKQGCTINIFNQWGELAYSMQSKVKHNKIDLRGWSVPGIYYLRVISNDRFIQASKKFVPQ